MTGAASALRGRTALVTGAAGFVGGHMTRWLAAAGADVVALDLDAAHDRPCQLSLDRALRARVRVVEADVLGGAALEALLGEAGCDFVFHFATCASVVQRADERPGAALESNALGVVRVLEAMRRSGAAARGAVLVHASSDKVYGEVGDAPYDEERSPLAGRGVYAAAKIAADLFARTLAAPSGARVAVARMCNLFGPFDIDALEHRLVPRTLRAIFASPRSTPRVFARSREHRRDYLFVDDACAALAALAAHAAAEPAPRARVFNVPGVANLTTERMCGEVVAAAADVADPQTGRAIRQAGFEIEPAGGACALEIRAQQCDGRRLREATGFAPSTGIDEGLRRTAAWYRDYFAARR